MSDDYDFHKMHEIGYPRLVKLYQLPDMELKDFLRGLLPDIVKNNEGLFNEPALVTRTIKNGKVDDILIWYYESIVISWIGISHKPEHGFTKNVLSLCNEHISINIPEPKIPFTIT